MGNRKSNNGPEQLANSSPVSPYIFHPGTRWSGWSVPQLCLTAYGTPSNTDPVWARWSRY